jgi:hypothetical protein
MRESVWNTATLTFVLFTLCSRAIAADAEPVAAAEAIAVFDAGALRVGFGRTGQIQSLYDLERKKEYLVANQPAPLLTLVLEGKTVSPTSATYDEAAKLLKVAYGTGVTATVAVVAGPTHLRLELTSVDGARPTQIHWGPLPTTIGQSVGEVIGVVRDDKFALGIQSLGIETFGGATPIGPESSRLFASAIEQHGGIRGSKIALFGCPAAQALETIGKIEVAEGLPHPMLDGVWSKVSPTARLSFLVVSFGENTIEEACDFADKCGVKYVYHPGPFECHGHFKLNRAEFPDGDLSMQRCVQKAAARGIRLGVHTLSAFISPHDSYVTPVPDPRLARVGSSTLAAAVDASATEIRVLDPKPFLWQFDKTLGDAFGEHLNTAIVGQELIRYKAVSGKAPWALLGCQRGAWSTKASPHAAGADIGRLNDNYEHFFPTVEHGMLDEMTTRMAELFLKTGLRQTSFDGLSVPSGYGGDSEYARARFMKQCYDRWDARGLEVISDCGSLWHYIWHMQNRENWGEPWGKPMREGTRDFGNQAFFERNLLPHMIGWFELRTAVAAPPSLLGSAATAAAGVELEASTLDDFEWMLAKAAGYDAGFAVVGELGNLHANGQTSAILTAVKQWEALRLAQRFSDLQRQKLRSADEFHLESIQGGRWQIRPVDFSPRHRLALAGGQAVKEKWEIVNRFTQQPLRFVLRVTADAGGSVKTRVVNPSFQTGGRSFTFPVELRPQQYLVCRGERTATVYDVNWNSLGTVQADVDPPQLATGKSTVTFACHSLGREPLRLEMKCETRGRPESVP